MLWLRSQARRQAIPGLPPQFPVSVSGTSATPKPVAWNTRLLPTSATPREATGGFVLRGLRAGPRVVGFDRLAGGEDQVVRDVQGDRGEADGLQPGEERGRLDRVVGVALVELVQVVAGQAVRAEERAARAQHPERLGQHLVLQRAGGHVVQHRAGGHGVEGRVRVSRSAAASPRDHLDVGSGEPLGQPGGGLLLVLDRDQPARPGAAATRWPRPAPAPARAGRRRARRPPSPAAVPRPGCARPTPGSASAWRGSRS